MKLIAAIYSAPDRFLFMNIFFYQALIIFLSIKY